MKMGQNPSVKASQTTPLPPQSQCTTPFSDRFGRLCARVSPEWPLVARGSRPAPIRISARDRSRVPRRQAISSKPPRPFPAPPAKPTALLARRLVRHSLGEGGSLGKAGAVGESVSSSNHRPRKKHRPLDIPSALCFYMKKHPGKPHMNPGPHMLLDTFPAREEFHALLDASTVVPVGARILADTETPVSVLARFAPRHPRLFLLESAEGGERWGRYSFMGVTARATVAVYPRDVVVRQGIDEKRIPHGGAPLAVLRDLMKPYSLARIPGLPRLCAGLVGYFSYEMIHFFESRVPNRLPPERPLADSSFPTPCSSSTTSTTPSPPSPSPSRKTATPTPFMTPPAPASRACSTPSPPFRRPVSVPPHPHPAPSTPTILRPWSPPSKTTSTKATSSVRRFPVLRRPRPGLVSLYRAQRHVNPSPYLFFLKARIPPSSAPPRNHDPSRPPHRPLRPIAGTRPAAPPSRKTASSPTASSRTKGTRRTPHAGGSRRNELGRVALPGTVQVTDLMIVERYSHVMHLVSNITADLEPGHDAFDLLASSFPAGTLSGAPKSAPWKSSPIWKRNRGPYGGAVGYLSFDGNMDFCICIRTAVAEHGRLTIRAAGRHRRRPRHRTPGNPQQGRRHVPRPPAPPNRPTIPILTPNRNPNPNRNPDL